MMAQADAATVRGADLKALQHAGAAAGLLLILVLSTWLVQPVSQVLAWVVAMLVTGSLVLVGGHLRVGRWLGAFIDSTNKVSLARLQLTLWTILIVSALLVAALGNLFYATHCTGSTGSPGACIVDPLGISIPPQIWVLLGISATGWAGSALVLSTKQTGGVLLRKEGPTHANLHDMLAGDETGNGDYLDLGKVQMFFFTAVIAATYGVALGQVFAGDPKAGFAAFPPVSDGMAVLLGISHATNLVNAAVPHSPGNQSVAGR